MKKLVVLCLAITLFGCSLESDTPNFTSEVMAIESVDVPTEFIFGETHEITVTYMRPSGCHEFNRFFLESNGNARSVFVIDTVYLDQNCTQAEEQVTVSFDFLVISNETYIFQFYQGEDANGEDQYLIVEVPVAE